MAFCADQYLSRQERLPICGACSPNARRIPSRQHERTHAPGVCFRQTRCHCLDRYLVHSQATARTAPTWRGSPFVLPFLFCLLSAAGGSEILLPTLFRPALLPIGRPGILRLIRLVLRRELCGPSRWCLSRPCCLRGFVFSSDERHERLSLPPAVGAALPSVRMHSTGFCNKQHRAATV